MLKQIERLEEVERMLYMPGLNNEARRILTPTITQIRAEHTRIARAREAAIELLTRLRDVTIHGALYPDEIEEITQVIALLDGSAEEKPVREKCPRCHSPGWAPIDPITYSPPEHDKVYYSCDDCGYSEWREEPNDS